MTRLGAGASGRPTKTRHRARNSRPRGGLPMTRSGLVHQYWEQGRSRKPVMRTRLETSIQHMLVFHLWWKPRRSRRARMSPACVCSVAVSCRWAKFNSNLGVIWSRISSASVKSSMLSVLPMFIALSPDPASSSNVTFAPTISSITAISIPAYRNRRLISESVRK